MRSAITISLVDEARGGPFVFWDDLEAACRVAAELGFDAIELFAPAADAVDTARLKRLLDEHDLRLAAVGTGAGWVLQRLHLAMADARDRRRAEEFIRTMIDLGGEFGAPAIIGSMQGRSAGEVGAGMARKYLAESLTTLSAYAEQHQVPLLVEPLNRYETNLLNTLADGAEFAKLVGSIPARSRDNIRLLADLFHMNIEEVDLASAIRQAGPLIGHVHFVDTNRRAAGLGHMNYEPILSALREIDYTGYLSAEALPLPDSRAAAEQTIRAFRKFTT